MIDTVGDFSDTKELWFSNDQKPMGMYPKASYYVIKSRIKTAYLNANFVRIHDFTSHSTTK